MTQLSIVAVSGVDGHRVTVIDLPLIERCPCLLDVVVFVDDGAERLQDQLSGQR